MSRALDVIDYLFVAAFTVAALAAAAYMFQGVIEDVWWKIPVGAVASGLSLHSALTAAASPAAARRARARRECAREDWHAS